MEQAIRALTLVLQAGNFGLVVFDVGEAPADAVAPAAVHDLAAAAADRRRTARRLRAGRRRADGAQLGGADAATVRTGGQVEPRSVAGIRDPASSGISA